MGSHARSVFGEILTALQALHTNYDLRTVSSTPRVLIADDGPPMGTSPPYVLIGAPRLVPSYGGVAPMGQYDVRAELPWFGYAPTTVDTTTERALAACDLASDVVTAIEDAHASASASFATLHDLHELLVTVDDIFGAGIGVPAGCGICSGRISYAAVRTRGV